MKGQGRLLRDYPFPELARAGAPARARPRTTTLRGVSPLPLLRPPPIVETIEDTVVVDTDPDEEVTEVTVKPRAECTSCGYRARHVHTFPDGLCGLCRTTVGMTA